MSSFFSKLGNIADKVEEGVTRTRDQVSGLLNPNHRHDEAHEKEQDAIRAAINRSHRFESFAAERDLNSVKWHIDGHDFFWAMSELLDSAKECIFILDWWLSPELYLRRPPAYYPEWRIDRLLRRKAMEGVKVYIIVYKEVTQTMTMSSHHTKDHLSVLHPNIAVMRHPDHIGARDTVEFWSHHEKLCIVDNHRATVGGLDACFGRWDSHNHPMADCHPTEFKRTLFAGQDYNNSRIKDFQEVQDFASNQLSILETGRMPWHDVSCTMVGPVVLDLVQHFVERWNEVKKRKYAKNTRYDWLALPHDVENAPNEAVAQHPHREQWHGMGARFRQHFHWGQEQEEHEFDGQRYFKGPHGTCKVQVCRSVSDWSHGVLTERSIQAAYIQLIREANHCIYIENQFFISNTGYQDPVTNQVAKAIVERIISAHSAGQKFKIVVVIPEVPGFTGDIKETTAIQVIMNAQYRTVNRGGHSIFEELRKVGIEPLDYIRFFHLRSYDRINSPYESFVKKMEENSGVTFHQAQVAQARKWIGDTYGQWHQETIKIASGTTGARDFGDGGEQSGGAVGFGGPGQFGPLSKIQQAFGGGSKPAPKPDSDKVEAVPVPQDEAECDRLISQFERGAEGLRGDENVSDSVAQHVLGDSTSLLDEQWLGTPEEEKAAYVTEQLYIHTKLMIVDDKRVIIGSANLNDRSQKGDGDSEIAIVIEDTDLFETRMDGKPYMASRFAASLRRKLWREHLGLIEPQTCESDRDPITSFMHAAPVPNADESHLDRAVEDPLSAETINLWNQTAKKNTDIFSEVFHVVPSDRVKTWDEYKNYIPKDTALGHIVPEVSLEQAKELLAQVKGHLVEMPLGFLENEKDLPWNPLDPTLPIYI